MNKFDVIKNTTFCIGIVITVAMTVLGLYAYTRFDYLEKENNKLKKQIENQTLLIECLKKGD